MMNRDDIRNIICKIEDEYPVSEWRHNGYYIWPIFRIYLYLSLVKDNGRKNIIKKIKNNRLKKFQNLFSVIRDLFFLQTPVNKIYIGAPSHCVNYLGVEFNRYFHTLMDSDESLSLYLSKSNTKKGVYKPDQYLLLSPFRMMFNILNKVFRRYSSPTPFIKEFCEILQFLDMEVEGFEETLKERIQIVDVSFAMFRFLFKKLKPEQVWVLCYYSADMLGMLIAAHKLSIPTVDMQHGGQGGNHLAYSNWVNVPDDGYEALPDYFYTWDESSAKLINAWAKNNKKHSAIIYGNPWVDGWKQKKFRQSNYVCPENIILYTLQPTGEPLEEYILESIKRTHHKWNWWLRLHPRQMNEKEEVFSRLEEKGLLDYVNIEEASLLPLPEILTHTHVHITKFSGCALEAYQFDVPSIIIDKRGVDIYKEYIDDVNSAINANLTHNSQDLIKDIETLFYETIN